MDKQEIVALVGSNLKLHRERAEYTQEGFSELLGIGPKSLSAVERGQVGVSLQTLLRACEVPQISPNALLCRPSQAQDIAAQLGTMTPAQLEIVGNVIRELSRAFGL